MELAVENYPTGRRCRIHRELQPVIDVTLWEVNVHRKEGDIYFVRSVGYNGKENALRVKDMQRLYGE